MKIKNILLIGCASMSLSACNDFLDPDLGSTITDELIYSQESEIELALNGVYSRAIVDDLYGSAYQSTFLYNSDVDIKITSGSSHTHDGYRRLDCDDQGAEILKFWTAAYDLIETANRFIYGVENSPLLEENDKTKATLLQWLGEAKCLRAMAYHDMVVMFGDVPFTFEPAMVRDEYLFPVVDRTEIQKALIEDLQKASVRMASTKTCTVERCSKEFAQGLIARIALTAGGYSLRPDKSNPRSYGKMERPDNYKEFYKIARDYADSAIVAGNHSLKASFRDVFVNECNYKVVNDDDPIFELPFGKRSSGKTGYLQGPKYTDYNGATIGPWGKCDGSVHVNAFYRFLFRDNDLRREFVNGLWFYTYYTQPDGSMTDSVCIRADYNVHNNKWSKLWTDENNALGETTSGATGINFPYMRYADILLMFAEADNELTEAPSALAIDRLAQVHTRAFEDGDSAFFNALATKEEFHKAVMDERKWEFAGENIRWRDLVRTNTYAEELTFSFLRYCSAGFQNIGSGTGYEDAINAHDGRSYIDKLPNKIYYHRYRPTENIKPTAFFLPVIRAQFYGCQIDGTARAFIATYPNTSLQSLRILNAYKSANQPTKSTITNYGFEATEWSSANFYQWGNEGSGIPNDQCRYSFFGYARCDDNGNLWLVRDGALEPLPVTISGSEQLPPVRYILPYPNTVIQRSRGKYKNAYGY